MTMPAETEDPLTSYFWNIRWMLEPLRGSKWPPPKFIAYRLEDAQRWFAANWHEGFKLNFVVAEASGFGLVCKIVLRDEDQFLEFTRAKE